jgi:crossover junction endodeoxyribonuclease RusA|tara:strand:+ start:621 stop:1049 length:429 start_codon:yes stop_codon:yes gene_type:complete
VSEWRLFSEIKPWTTNAERSWHFQKRAKRVKQTREAFYELAQDVPLLKAVTVAAIPIARDKRGLQDVAACYPAVKAAIDGLVDAGVIEDDDQRFVTAITFYPTEVRGHDGLELVIKENDASDHRRTQEGKSGAHPRPEAQAP